MVTQEAKQEGLGLGIRQFYSGKTIFLTGTTGFVGKVVLEKIIRAFPDFKRIFVMIRSKKNMSLDERLDKTVLSSEIFDPLFKHNISLKESVRARIIPIAGDLIINKLGLSAADRAMVTAETDVLINCAASVSFDDPLLDALQINYFGCKRMLELAHECKRLRVFSHVSTAYVNSNILDGSKIEEKVYDLPNGQDPEDVVRQIINMGPQSVTEQEKNIIGAYPNTYTFTKSLAERMLKKNRGNLPVVILRPSII